MNTMLTRLATSLLLVLIIFLIIYLENIWIFSLAISFVCILGIFEWVTNKFENLFLGLFLIFGFGSCSILYVLLNENFYLLLTLSELSLELILLLKRLVLIKLLRVWLEV